MNNDAIAATNATILVVDDMPDNLTFLNAMLSMRGYKVRSALSGQLAIQSAQAKRPDLILLDILMPNMDGFEVCQQLKSIPETCDIPIIFASALHDPLDKVKAFSVGGADYITKPISPPEAIARIEHQLSLSRLRQQLMEKNIHLEQEVKTRQQAEEALKRLLREVSDIKFALDQSAIVAITDLQGQIIYANDHFCDISKYSRQELLGNTHRIVNSGYHAPEFFQQMWRTIGQGQVWKGEIRNQAKDETFYWVETVIVPQLDENNTPYQYVSIRREISDRKKAEAEILKSLKRERELNDLKTRFVSMVSHEYRTPLTTILSSLDLLEHYGHCSTPQEKREFFQQIRTAVQKMTELLEDVLSFNKAESGLISLHPAPVDVVRFCEMLVLELQRITPTSHQIQFTSEVKSLQGQMDEKLLHHIFGNLISNAVKYTPEGGIIKFEVACQHQSVLFTVQDPGIGIPPDSMGKLFRAFFRAGNVGTICGTGLGLSIVKHLVEIHQGIIQVESQVGVGSTFKVTLPLQLKI